VGRTAVSPDAGSVTSSIESKSSERRGPGEKGGAKRSWKRGGTGVVLAFFFFLSQGRILAINAITHQNSRVSD
jgi:hypothetical protein